MHQEQVKAAHGWRSARGLHMAAMTVVAVATTACAALPHHVENSPSVTSANANPSPIPAVSPALSLADALKLATSALDICRAKGFAASVSVVDAQGLARVTLRDDGAVKPPVAAPLKAATAVAFDAPGSELEAREKTDPTFAALIKAHPETYNDHPGSMPIHDHGALIGGLAIADVPHDVADACARQALERDDLR